jgi:hypothetical protein
MTPSLRRTEAGSLRRALGAVPAAVLPPVTLLLLVAGCRGGRVAVPRISPGEASRQALAEYDRNGDGLLDAAELERCPALKSCLKDLDKNGDSRLSGEEIAERILAYQTSRVGLQAFACQVTLDGRPLAGATITFIPEPFLGPALKPASGVSDSHGMARLQEAGADLPGVPCGLYRVEVSKKDAGGRELVPARYNTRSVLGQEVAPDTAGHRGVVQFRLSNS